MDSNGNMLLKTTVFLIIAIIILPIRSFAVRCESIFRTEIAELHNENLSEATKHFISQEDSLFTKFSLLEPSGESALCGISSLANYINLQLMSRKQAMQKDLLIQWISEKSIDFMYKQRMEGNRGFSIKGMYSFDLANLAKALLPELDIKGPVLNKSVLLSDQSIKLEDLNETNQAIWSLQFIDANTEENGASHFILVLDYDKAASTITFSDPLEPTKLKKAKVNVSQNTNKATWLRVDLMPGSTMDKLTPGQTGYFLVSGIVGFKEPFRTSKKVFPPRNMH